MKRVVAVASVLVVGGAVAATAVLSNNGSESKAPASMDIHVVTQRGFAITTTASGELEARNQVEIRNRMESRSTIVEVVPEGTQVRQGDVLVRLNADTIRTQLEEETLRVESARAELTAAEQQFLIQQSENESALRQANLKLELAQLELDQWKEGDVASRRQQLRLDLDRANREVERLTDRVKRSRELQSQGFLSRDELQRDELALVEAEASLERARLNREVYEEYQYPKDEKTRLSAVEEAKAEIERVQRRNESQLAQRRADLENRRRQVNIREDRLAKLEQQLEAATVRAPSSGLVVHGTTIQRGRWGGEGPLEVGRDVSSNELLIVLPDTSEMVAAVRVHESLASRLRRGQEADVTIEAAGSMTVRGRVIGIGVLAEAADRWRDPNLREYTVRILLDSDHGADLKPSMRAEAQITLGEVEDAIAVPTQAVFTEGQIRYVYVQEGRRFVRRPVNVGRRSDRFAEIVAGVSAGERVLLREPSPGEVISRPWDEEELAAAGLAYDESGSIVSVQRLREAAEREEEAQAAALTMPPGGERRRPGGPGQRQQRQPAQPPAPAGSSDATATPSETQPD